MKVSNVNIADIHPAPWNVRTGHDVDGIAESIRINGFRDPIEVWRETGEIVAGEGRYHAAKALQLAEVPVIYHDFGGLAEAKRYGIANNRFTDKSEWDLPALEAQLEELDSLAGTGFGEDDLPALGGGSAGEVTEDEFDAEPPSDPVTQPGDLYILGEHRLLCGDSTSAEDVARLLDGTVPFIMVTDPPYGVEYDPDWRNELLNDADRRTGQVENDGTVDWTEAYLQFPGHVAYVWHADRHASDLVINLSASGFTIRSQIIWRKQTFAISRGHYHWQHEPCWYAVRGGGSAKWCGDRSQSTVWDITNRVNDEDRNNHGTQKPIECMARPIRNHGGKGDDVYDPFLGSGTTLIAAEQLGRRCFGMEISPAYCDVIVARWEKLTGGTAERIPALETAVT